MTEDTETNTETEAPVELPVTLDMKEYFPPGDESWKEILPKSVTEILTRLEDAGFEARVCGGAVRDLVWEKDPKDFDLATSAKPDEVMEVFSGEKFLDVESGLAHGTVFLMFKGEQFEITTLRIDEKTDGRHAEVSFTTDWELDANRRDFTMNALFLTKDLVLEDWVGGLEDIRRGRIRFVGDAATRMQEDYLRILRFFRFAAWLGLPNTGYFDEETLDTIAENAAGLSQISNERVRMEILQTMKAPNSLVLFRLMRDCNVLKAVGMDYKFDLNGTKIAMGMTKNPITILAATLRGVEDDDERKERATFLMKRLVMTRDEKRLFRFLLREKWLLRYKKPKFFQSLMALEGASKEMVMELARFGGNLKACAFLKDLEMPKMPVNGKDLMDDQGFTPGKELGDALNELKAAWVEADFTENKDELMTAWKVARGEVLVA